MGINVMLILMGVILLALAPDEFRFRLYEYAVPLVVLGVLSISLGVWRLVL